MCYEKKVAKNVASTRSMDISVSRPKIWGTQTIKDVVPLGTKSVFFGWVGVRTINPEVQDFTDVFHGLSTLLSPLAFLGN